MTVVIVALLATLAIPIYSYTIRRIEDIEAITSMDAIRRAEYARHMGAASYTNAADTAAINRLFALGIEDRLFRYKVVEADDTYFKIIATRLGAIHEGDPMVVIAMGPDGDISYGPVATAPPPPEAGGENPRGSGGGGSSSGGGGGGGGSGGSGGGGGGSGGSSLLGGGSGGSGSTGVGGNGSAATKPKTSFPDATEPNIKPGENAARMQSVFDVMASAGDLGASLAQVLILHQIPISFDDIQALFGNQVSDSTIGVLAGPSYDGTDGDTILILDTSLLGLSDEEIAATLAHEATHAKQRFDAELLKKINAGNALVLTDIEGPAYINETLVWDNLRRDAAGNIVLTSSDSNDLDFRADSFILPGGTVDEAAHNTYISSSRGISPLTRVSP